MGAVSLKTQNLVPLSALALLQLMTAYFVTQGKIDLSQFKSLASTGGAALALSVVTAWFSCLLPTDIKNSLVFLRLKCALPGHRFIKLSRADSRIDFELLKHRVADFDVLDNNPLRQNQYWYKEIYRPIANELEVASVHKSYLLYRDAAAISLISILILWCTQILFPSITGVINQKGLIIFVLFFIGFVVAANSTGRRFVTTSVAIYLSK
jgi:hypothetical protein